jgi:hypothetical protein
MENHKGKVEKMTETCSTQPKLGVQGSPKRKLNIKNILTKHTFNGKAW